MMNVVEVDSSECSSGCESGWTLYLQHSTTTSNSTGFKRATYVENRHQKSRKMTRFENEDDVNDNNDNVFSEQQEEDLSMVSDASSGPPLFNLDRRQYTDADEDEDEDEEEEDDDDLFYENESVMFRNQCMKSYPHETQCYNDDNYNYNYNYNYNSNSNEGDFALDDTASSHVFTSKKIGGNNKGASFERFIDYSSQCYSSTHVKVNLERRS